MQVFSKDISVGDVIEVKDDETVPADCVILGTSLDPNGLCYISTTSLDGERNLKPRFALKFLKDNTDLLFQAKRKISVFRPDPEKNLEYFQSKIII